MLIFNLVFNITALVAAVGVISAVAFGMIR